MTASTERRARFKGDMTKLAEWLAKEHLSDIDTIDASSMLFRWLFDKHPMLQDLCNELGIQLTLPGVSDACRAFYKEPLIEQAIFALPLTLGKRNLLGYQWTTRTKFANDTAMIINGTTVSVEAFIKFVRHKLGGGHFDEEDRKRWQKEIVEMSEYWEIKRNILNVHMMEIVRAVCEGIAENRVEQHAI